MWTIEVVDGEGRRSGGPCPRGSRRWASRYMPRPATTTGGVTIKRWVWELSDEVTVNDRGAPVGPSAGDDPCHARHRSR